MCKAYLPVCCRCWEDIRYNFQKDGTVQQDKPLQEDGAVMKRTQVIPTKHKARGRIIMRRKMILVPKKFVRKNYKLLLTESTSEEVGGSNI